MAVRWMGRPLGWMGVTVNNTCIKRPFQIKAQGEMSADQGKKAAAYACGADLIKSNQKIGVGSGTTVKYLIDYIKEQIDSGKLTNIVCVPTSFLTRHLLQQAKIPVVSPETHWELDITIDGADELDPSFNCIKGGGGCLLQEKIVQHCAKEFVIIADDSKRSQRLGEKFAYIPLEVTPFGYVVVQKHVEKHLGGKCELRMAKNKCGAVITDNNNYILDWHFPKSTENVDWNKINIELLQIPGLVETGLFLNVAKKAYLGKNDGQVLTLNI